MDMDSRVRDLLKLTNCMSKENLTPKHNFKKGEMMGRSPCCDDKGLKKGPWTPEEDNKLVDYIQNHGHGSWRALPKLAGLNRCGKSCRLRWTNYLRPDIKRGKFSDEEEQIIINLHSVLGNKWSAIASNLQGRTDNEIKNYWNTHLRKKLMSMGIDPVTHRPRTDHLNLLANLPQLLAAANLSNLMFNPDAASQLAKAQLLQNLLQVLSTSSTSTPLPPTVETINHFFGTSPPSLFHDPRLFESLRSINFSHDHHLLNGLVNGQVNFSSHDHSQMGPLSFPNLEAYNNGHSSSQQLDLCNSYAIAPDTNHMPPLVSASPKHSTFNEMTETKMMIDHMQPSTIHDISNPSSTSTTIIEAWGDQLVDDEASDSYWKDIIDQASSLPWTPTS